MAEGTCFLDSFRHLGGGYVSHLDDLLGPHLVPLDTPITRLADAIDLERGSIHPSYHSGERLANILKKLVSMGKLEIEDVREASLAIEDEARVEERGTEVPPACNP